jgi:K+-sensing histidine kinase KdpD
MAAEGCHATAAQTVVETLAGHARQRQAALVVVGSRGRSAVREALSAAWLFQPLHHAHRPVRRRRERAIGTASTDRGVQPSSLLIADSRHRPG